MLIKRKIVAAKALLALVSLFVFTSCGGGGGGGSSSSGSETASIAAFVYQNLRSVSVEANIYNAIYNSDTMTNKSYLSGLSFVVEGCEVTAINGIQSGSIELVNGVTNLAFTATLRDDCYSEKGYIYGAITTETTVTTTETVSGSSQQVTTTNTFTETKSFSLQVNSKYAVAQPGDSGVAGNYQLARVDTIAAIDAKGGSLSFVFKATDADSGAPLSGKSVVLSSIAPSSSYGGSALTDSGGYASVNVTFPQNNSGGAIAYYYTAECGDAHISFNLDQAAVTAPFDTYGLALLTDWGTITTSAQDVNIYIKLTNAQSSSDIANIPVKLSVVGDSNASIVDLNNTSSAYKTYTAYSSDTGMLEYTLRFSEVNASTVHNFVAVVDGSSSDASVLTFTVTQQ